MRQKGSNVRETATGDVISKDTVTCGKLLAQIMGRQESIGTVMGRRKEDAAHAIVPALSKHTVSLDQ